MFAHVTHTTSGEKRREEERWMKQVCCVGATQVRFFMLYTNVNRVTTTFSWIKSALASEPNIVNNCLKAVAFVLELLTFLDHFAGQRIRLHYSMSFLLLTTPLKRPTSAILLTSIFRLAKDRYFLCCPLLSKDHISEPHCLADVFLDYDEHMHCNYLSQFRVHRPAAVNTH